MNGRCWSLADFSWTFSLRWYRLDFPAHSQHMTSIVWRNVYSLRPASPHLKVRFARYWLNRLQTFLSLEVLCSMSLWESFCFGRIESIWQDKWHLWTSSSSFLNKSAFIFRIVLSVFLFSFQIICIYCNLVQMQENCICPVASNHLVP